MTQSLCNYAHRATEQQYKSLKGCGVPLDFIKEIENGVFDLKEALENVKTYVAYDNSTDFHTADIHCALAAVHFCIAKKDGYGDKMLEEIANDFSREMKIFFDLSPFSEKTKLDENLRKMVTHKFKQ